MWGIGKLDWWHVGMSAAGYWVGRPYKLCSKHVSSHAQVIMVAVYMLRSGFEQWVRAMGSSNGEPGFEY